MKIIALAMLTIAGAVTIGLFMFLLNAIISGRVIVMSAVLILAIFILTLKAAQQLEWRKPSGKAFMVVLAIISCAAIACFPRYTDHGSNWNEAVKAIHLVQRIVKSNERYALAHQGSFAPDIKTLHEEISMIPSYTIIYEPSEDKDHLFRHYILRCVPDANHWISIYTDETGIVRESEHEPASKNSRAIL
jgi:hypothetical protein